MAENKKSFVLYADLIGRIEHLTDEEKGVLFQHLLEYVNDLNPVLEDRILIGVWKPIEQQLKRDLRKFEEVKSKRSDAGKESARLRALKKDEQNSTKSTSVESVKQISTNPTVNDNVNDNVNDIIYSESDFLEDWCKIRTHYMKKPTNINKLDFNELNNFNSLLKDYSKKDIQSSMLGLFKQKNKNITSMYLKPKHFLENLNKYLNAEIGKDYELYGKEQSIKKTGGL